MLDEGGNIRQMSVEERCGVWEPASIPVCQMLGLYIGNVHILT